MTKFTAIVHWTTVALMAAAVLAATGVGFAQSWAGLYGWALEHQLHGWKAASFPAMVDLFIAVGELGLFKLAIEGHHLRRALLPWLDLLLPLVVAVAGWVASLLFNIGHVGGTTNDKVTAAVPPIASMLGLFVLLSALHRLVTRAGEAPANPVAEPSGSVLQDAPVTGVDDTESGHPTDEVADDEPAAHINVVDLATAVRAARKVLPSERAVAKAFGISRHKVKDYLEQPAGPDEIDDWDRHAPAWPYPARVNGHHPTGDEQ